MSASSGRQLLVRFGVEVNEVVRQPAAEVNPAVVEGACHEGLTEVEVQLVEHLLLQLVPGFILGQYFRILRKILEHSQAGATLSLSPRAHTRQHVHDAIPQHGVAGTVAPIT